MKRPARKTTRISGNALVSACAAGLAAAVLAGCATMESHEEAKPSTADDWATAERDADPFTAVEQAIDRITAVPPKTIDVDPPPPDLWASVIERFEFARCPEDSRAEYWASWFAERDDYMERVLNRARPWLYDIAGELEQRDLPGELALLPIVESAYDPFAYSHGRAAGAWQFLSSTASARGIRIDDYYDGRRDVWMATRAALDYLDELHQRFGDWNLALAAYNGGQGRVQRALDLNRTQARSEQWNALRLPRETLAYVPKLNGLGCLFAEADQYDFQIPRWDPQPTIERIEFEGPIDIVALAWEADLDLAELVALNPALNSHLTPPDGPHHLFVPVDQAGSARDALESLQPDDMQIWKEVTVRSGDTLSHIARRYDTSIASLREANDLNGDLLRPGQTLRLTAANGEVANDAPHADGYDELAALHERLLPRRRFQHQVRPGENLWVIARQYGVSVSDLQQWNRLGDSQLIRPGDRLNIHVDQRGGQSGQTTRYTVRSGDSLWIIARRNQVSINDLLRWNDISRDSVLQPGQTLIIRRGGGA